MTEPRTRVVIHETIHVDYTIRPHHPPPVPTMTQPDPGPLPLIRQPELDPYIHDILSRSRRRRS